ncbi:hypothetical protein VP01_762g5 [Puccinia sorghi]|uniref:Uncharacterized protein n=1 Tax=Puccinia sorghi TaxID=27349 RepID=A0A0L6UCQ3_9BASI|nr:hypothetical protein VP01_762g5 [Puccinia sorghi]
MRNHNSNTYSMWNALLQGHQDSSTGGQVYWIRELILTKMENDKIFKHIDTMEKYYEHLNSLITPAKPLTPDDFHSPVLLSYIPQDWLHCVSVWNYSSGEIELGREIDNYN